MSFDATVGQKQTTIEAHFSFGLDLNPSRRWSRWSRFTLEYVFPKIRHS